MYINSLWIGHAICITYYSHRWIILKIVLLKGSSIYIMVIYHIDIFKFWLFLYWPAIDNLPNFPTGNTSSNEKQIIALNWKFIHQEFYFQKEEIDFE